jgi:hypothetical protein
MNIINCVKNIQHAMEIIENRHIDVLITEMVLNNESPIILIA